MDALIDDAGRERVWPAAECIVGNPPFLGDKAMIRSLGEAYTKVIRKVYEGRVPGGADLVCYWFEKARAMIEAGTAKRAGLVSTNSIRGGANRKVLDNIVKTQVIFDAWSDQPWEQDGAAVRVSLVCFESKPGSNVRYLDGHIVADVFSDLTAGSSNITVAARLSENRGYCFQGPVKVGPFDIPGELARRWLLASGNPNGKSNSDVVRPWANGMDIVRRPSDTWIVDFSDRSEADAAMYELPFEYIRRVVKPERDKNRRDRRRIYWWQHGETVPGLRLALEKVSRYIITPRVSKHRIYVWMSSSVLPDSAVVATIRDDDTTFGILHSRFHEIWALRMGTSLEDRPRYTPTTTFETFPFPQGLTPDIPATDHEGDPRAQRIAAAARRLNELRDNWLNPEELVRREPEVVPGYPDRLVPRGPKAEAELKKRTLTNLYNQRPAWLDLAHKALDEAVAAAYGWPADLSDDDILARLLVLNHERAAKQGDAGGPAADDTDEDGEK